MISLLEGDCQEILKDIHNGSVDLKLVDPPYGKTACNWDKVLDFGLLWPELKRIRKHKAATLVFSIEPYASKLRLSNEKEYKFDWFWDKVTRGVNLSGKYRPSSVVENILVFGESALNYYPVMVRLEKPSVKDFRCYKDNTQNTIKFEKPKEVITYTHLLPKNLISIKRPAPQGRLNPTQKPVELLEYLIKTYSKEGQTVLDFTMGSGTTGIACLNTGRSFIGIEKDPDQFERASLRMSQRESQTT